MRALVQGCDAQEAWGAWHVRRRRRGAHGTLGKHLLQPRGATALAGGVAKARDAASSIEHLVAESLEHPHLGCMVRELTSSVVELRERACNEGARPDASG
jgi:uncharacterized protein (UPF0264 family)